MSGVSAATVHELRGQPVSPPPPNLCAENGRRLPVVGRLGHEGAVPSAEAVDEELVGCDARMLPFTLNRAEGGSSPKRRRQRRPRPRHCWMSRRGFLKVTVAGAVGGVASSITDGITGVSRTALYSFTSTRGLRPSPWRVFRRAP